MSKGKWIALAVVVAVSIFVVLGRIGDSEPVNVDVRTIMVNSINSVYRDRGDESRVYARAQVLVFVPDADSEQIWQDILTNRATSDFACVLLTRKFSEVVSTVKSAGFTHVALSNSTLRCRL